MNHLLHLDMPDKDSDPKIHIQEPQRNWFNRSSYSFKEGLEGRFSDSAGFSFSRQLSPFWDKEQDSQPVYFALM